MHIRLKQAMVALSAVMLLTTTIDSAEARIRSKSGFSRGSSYSSPAPRAAPAPRVGNGGSAGLTRPQVSERARSAPPVAPGTAQPMTPVQTAKSPNYVPSYPAPVRPQEQRRSGNWVAPAVAGVAAGALAGYALADSPNQPSAAPATSAASGVVPDNRGTSESSQDRSGGEPGAAANFVAPAAAGLAAPIAGAPVQMPATDAPADGSWLGWLLLLALLSLGGAVIWSILRKVPSSTTPKSRPSVMPLSSVGSSGVDTYDAGQSLLREAKQLFQEIQHLHNAGNLSALKERLTSDMLRGVTEDIRARTEESLTTVVSVDCTLLDCTDEGDRLVASVHYQSLIAEHPGNPPVPVSEVWHFVKERSGFGWKLAGIEQA